LTRCPSGSRKIIERLPQGWVFGDITARHPYHPVPAVGLAARVAAGFRFHNGFLPGPAGLALVLAHPDTFLPSLARSLDDLGITLPVLGRAADAAAAGAEAEAIRGQS
jgi:hypothetical protein